jgi:diacylglycerol kinase (ATP)
LNGIFILKLIRSHSYLWSQILYSSIACTAERFFRIDRAQEHLHFVVDICTDDLYILDPENPHSEEKDDIDFFETASQSSLNSVNAIDNNNSIITTFNQSSGDEIPTHSLSRRSQSIPNNPISVPTTFSPDEVLQAAKLGDLSLLKQLHHKGINLLAIDEKGIKNTFLNTFHN